MRIHNEITLGTPADELFAFLSDVERVAPCLPGASVEGREGEDYAGRMKVKVGPINATYQGTMRFVELDKDARRAVMRARAEEVNGQGNAEATITTEVEESGEGSVVRMDTDLQMRGKVAQFGRGAMEKISQRMFSEFARNIEQTLSENGGAGADHAASDGSEAAPAEARPEDRRDRTPAPAGEARPAGRRERARARSEEEDGPALDLLGTIGPPWLGTVAPIAGAALVLLGYGYLLGQLRESRATVRRIAQLL